MAIKKPLVITNGQVEQLQPGDKLDLARSVIKQNNTGGPLVICTPVYALGGNANPAQADSQSTVRVVGFVAETAPDASPVEVQTDGVLTALTTEWDAVTGQTGGLTEGTTYYLSEALAGHIVTAAPTAQGDYVIPLGFALSATEFEIEIGQPIKL